MITVTQKHLDEAQKIANNMKITGARYDVEMLAESVAIIEWAKANEDFRSNSGVKYMNVTATEIYGKPEVEAVEFIVNKVAKKKQRAGADALKRKYGSEAARRIIAKYAGN